MGLLGILAIIGIFTGWTIFGNVPTTISGKGLIVRNGGLVNVVSNGPGIVRTIDVEVGQRVVVGQVVAQIHDSSVSEQVRSMSLQIAETKLKLEADFKLRSEDGKAQIEAIERRRLNTVREIGVFEDRAKLARDQVPVMEQLFNKGLVTKQQTIATQQKLVDLQGQIEGGHADLKNGEAQAVTIRSGIERSVAANQLELANLERQLTTYQNEKARVAKIISPFGGAVLELKVSAGASVREGMPIISVQPEVDSLEAVAYLPSDLVKMAKHGMEAQISPSMVKREEFGYILGTISFVADYPATPAALMRNFQNESLTSALSASGPVTEVRVRLHKCPENASGFCWSSSKGPPLKISSGTMSEASIVTERRAPITLLVPHLKLALGLT